MNSWMEKFAFPSSNYLAKHWWHRLMLAGFWAWVLVLVYQFGTMFGEEGFRNGLMAGIGTYLFGPYIAACMFGLAYHLILFIAMGDKWKDCYHPVEG